VQDPKQNPQQSQESPASQILDQINDGLMKLASAFGQAQLPEETQKHLEGIITSFQALSDDLSGAAQPEAPMPQGPMDMNASPDAKPAY
jgi:hypothetical protein